MLIFEGVIIKPTTPSVWCIELLEFQLQPDISILFVWGGDSTVTDERDSDFCSGWGCLDGLVLDGLARSGWIP